jgi:hypothetical protein
MYTRSRNALGIIVVMLFIASFTSRAFAPTPKVGVTPSTATVQLGQEITVNITVTDMTAPGLWSYGLKLHYNNTLLNATDSQIPPDHMLKPSLDPTYIFIVQPGIINQTEGIVSFALTLFADEPGKTGSGTLGTVTFKGLAMGSANLELIDVELVDPVPNLIDPALYTVGSGTIQVIPEFALAVLIAAFMLMSAAVVVLKKRLR